MPDRVSILILMSVLGIVLTVACAAGYVWYRHNAHATRILPVHVIHHLGPPVAPPSPPDDIEMFRLYPRQERAADHVADYQAPADQPFYIRVHGRPVRMQPAYIYAHGTPHIRPLVPEDFATFQPATTVDTPAELRNQLRAHLDSLGHIVLPRGDGSLTIPRFARTRRTRRSRGEFVSDHGMHHTNESADTLPRYPTPPPLYVEG